MNRRTLLAGAPALAATALLPETTQADEGRSADPEYPQEYPSPRR